MRWHRLGGDLPPALFPRPGFRMARRATATRDTVASRSVAHAPTPALPADFPLTTLALIAIFVARWTTPTEGAVLGETLWIAASSALLPVLWCVERWWRGLGAASITRWEAAVWLLVAGPLVGGGVLLVAGGGDRRAALNLMGEWWAFGATATVAWRCLSASRSARGALVVVVVALGGSLAGMGCVQHYHTFPRQAAEYRDLRTRLDALSPTRVKDTGVVLANAGLERQALSRRLEAMGVPDDPGTRLLWEQRLLDSHEPLGLVALANTFAGLLLVVVFLTGGLLWRMLGGAGVGSHRSGAMLLLTGVLLIAVVCLVLTKSRTAYVGGLVAAGLGAASVLGGGRVTTRGWGLGMGGGVVGGALLVLVLWGTGGLDRLVLLESAKSLRYRLEYWTASLRGLTESPVTILLGCGPGNFRQHYLAHKLPQSSEEIADPHNMVLDMWANGGLLGVAGLAVLGGLLAGGLVRALPGREGTRADDETVREAPVDFRVVVGGLVAGTLVTYLVTADERVAGVGLAAVGIVLWWSRCPEGIAVPGLAAGLGGLALGIHLLGAGGIGMPAVQSGLLVCGLLLGRAVPLRFEGHRDTELVSLAGPWRGVAAGVLGGGAIVVFGLWPEWSRAAAIERGDTAYRLREDYESAAMAYALAGRVDPFSTEGPLRAAQLRFEQWRARSRKPVSPVWDSSAVFKIGSAALLEAISRDPRNAHLHELSGRVWLERWRATREIEDARKSAAAYEHATRLYPNNGGMQADRVEAVVACGEDATAVARQALRLDDLARQYGHRDKELSNERRAVLERYLAGKQVRERPAGG